MRILEIHAKTVMQWPSSPEPSLVDVLSFLFVQR